MAGIVIAFITAGADAAEVHELAVIIKVYVFACKAVINVEVPVPLTVMFPGKIFITQEPLEGRPVNKTDPVAEEQVG